MDPHTHVHKKLIINSSWGESSGSLLEDMASMEGHQGSHIFADQDQRHNYAVPSLDHPSPVWKSCSSHHTNYIISSHNSSQVISSLPASLFFVGSNPIPKHHVGLPTNHHHQQPLDHDLYSHVHEEDEQEEETGNHKDMFVAAKEDEILDLEVDEELSAMKEMMYKIAVMQPVDIDPSTIRKPKRRNVRISDDPQSVSARHRRERISEKMRILQRLVPGGTKMDTASMLDEAIMYVKFLKRQIKQLQKDQNHPHDHDQLPPTSSSLISTSPVSHQYLTANMANNRHQQCVGFVAAAPIPTDHGSSTLNDSILSRHDREDEKSFDNLKTCMNNNNKVHQCMDNAIQTHQQIGYLLNQGSGFVKQG